jgi:hypothetical protein
MTPKEKAIELVNKYLQIYDGRVTEAKRCALIAVDEILNLCWNGNLKAKEYWEEVKQEILKL